MKLNEKIISLDRENITDAERELFLKDLRRVISEYFETDGRETLEITRADDGFLVCIIFSARRIKTVKTLV